MSNNNTDNNWVDAIRSKASHATRQVPQGTWDAIAKSMAQHEQQVKPKRAIITPRLWKSVAAAAVVALVATTGFFIVNNDDTTPRQPQPLAHVEKPSATGEKSGHSTTPAQSPSPQQATQVPTPAAITPSTLLAQNNPAAAKRHTTAQPAPPKAHGKGHRTKHKSTSSIAPDNDLHNEFLDSELMAASDNQFIDLAKYPNEFNPEDYFYDIETIQALEQLYAQQYDNAMNQEAMKPWKNYVDSTYQQHLVYDANARRAAREKMALTKRHKEPTLLLAAYGNGLISTDHDATVGGSSAMLMTPAASNPPMMLAPGVSGNTPRLIAPPVNFHYHHHMPLTAGITFNKRIVGNLYGNLGVNFTSMTSDVTPDNGSDEFKQKVMLVGVPIGVKWNFWHYRGLSTFIGGEALVERVVSAKFNNESITIKRLQWSVHATAGLQYNFNRHVGIYLAPKLSHYITTLPLSTLRNEHPLNFNLQLGLSLDF